MKIEIVKETKVGKPDWFYIVVDGQELNGSGILSIIESQYESIISDPNVLKITREVLKSQEIDVPLTEETTKIE